VGEDWDVMLEVTSRAFCAGTVACESCGVETFFSSLRLARAEPDVCGRRAYDLGKSDSSAIVRPFAAIVRTLGTTTLEESKLGRDISDLSLGARLLNRDIRELLMRCIVGLARESLKGLRAKSWWILCQLCNHDNL
jgi:hypothetical protein